MISLKQVLGTFCKKTTFSDILNFNLIVGNDDIKLVFKKALLSKRPVHILLVGRPGCAKTMFLIEIMKIMTNSYFLVGSNTTKAGLINQLFEKRPKYILVDELEKMKMDDQTSLLHLMETGIISETKVKKTRQLELISWVFATANNCQGIIEPLLSRFVVLHVPEYTYEEFAEIAVHVLRKEDIDRPLALLIAEKVWGEFESKDMRDVIKVARLVRDREDISDIVAIMKDYSK